MDPFARFSNVSWPLVACVTLVSASGPFVFRGASLTGAQPPVKKVVFEGKWDGKFENNKGETGEGKYLFHKEQEGRFDVTVSWDNDMKKMEIKGERLGPDALRLEGKYKDTTYWYIGRVEGGGLVLRYLSVDGTGQSGSGVSRLTRPK